MKKNLLSLAVTAGVATLASTANAMYVNDRGTGEALVYPFYSAANGNDTYIHIVNTTNRVKAVKVRIIEGQNSQEVLDFNLYLSANDVFAAAITKQGDGALIRTVDTSCTVPALGTSGGANTGALAGTTVDQTDVTTNIQYEVRSQPFVPFKFASSDKDTSLGRTLEGYIEVFEMAQYEEVTTPPASGAAPAIGYAATHVPVAAANGVTFPAKPANCGAIVDAWTQNASTPTAGLFLADADAESLNTTTGWEGGGLYGYATVINVDDGTAFSYDATAVEDYYAPGDGAVTPIATLHSVPGTVNPEWTESNTNVTILDGVTPEVFDFANPANTDAQNSLDAASALFMSLNVSNDYVLDEFTQSSTDWVLTLPTKRAYVNVPAVTPPATPNPAIPPFTGTWDGEKACEAIGIARWDREEKPTIIDPTGPVFSPQPPSTDPDEITLCKEVNVVSFSETRKALNATDSVGVALADIDDQNGWARVSFDPATLVDKTINRNLVDANGRTLTGLPVVGFAAIKYNNGVADGGSVVRNYAGAIRHKATVSITN